MTETNDVPETPAKGKKRRPQRVSYAEKFRDMERQCCTAIDILQEAAKDGDIAVVKRLISIALKTLE